MLYIKLESDICRCEGPCFAKTTITGSNPKCAILTEPYVSNCPFQKPEREVTNGKRYFYSRYYPSVK